jgi:hypothetical protein
MIPEKILGKAFKRVQRYQPLFLSVCLYNYQLAVLNNKKNITVINYIFFFILCIRLCVVDLFMRSVIHKNEI